MTDKTAYLLYLEEHPKPYDSPAGQQAFQTLIDEGVDPEKIIGSARSYRRASATFSQENYIQSADNFLDEKRGTWKKYIEKPASKSASESDLVCFWADMINKGSYVHKDSVTYERACAMLEGGLVSEEKLKALGFGFEVKKTSIKT